VNTEYLKSLDNRDVLQVDIQNALAVERSAEMDEMWSFYHDKHHKYGFGG
jgi:hypothetical protein